MPCVKPSPTWPTCCVPVAGATGKSSPWGGGGSEKGTSSTACRFLALTQPVACDSERLEGRQTDPPLPALCTPPIHHPPHHPTVSISNPTSSASRGQAPSLAPMCYYPEHPPPICLPPIIIPAHGMTTVTAIKCMPCAQCCSESFAHPFNPHNSLSSPHPQFPDEAHGLSHSSSTERVRPGSKDLVSTSSSITLSIRTAHFLWQRCWTSGFLPSATPVIYVTLYVCGGGTFLKYIFYC